MTKTEFVERTGFEPTADEYATIERMYYEFDGDKDAFCKAFVARGDEKLIYHHRAELIAELKSLLVETEKEYKAKLIKLEKELALVRADLDKELDWQPSDSCGTNMSQDAYEALDRAGHRMTDEEAKKFIAEECGFDPEKIWIVREVSTYEVNKHRMLRKARTMERAPVYEATDWNYVRFDCAYFAYELVDGELRFYCA